MNFRAKILLSPLIAVTLMLLLGAVAFVGIRPVQSNLNQLANVNMQRLIQATEARDQLLLVNTDVFKLFTWMSFFKVAGSASPPHSSTFQAKAPAKMPRGKTVMW